MRENTCSFVCFITFQATINNYLRDSDSDDGNESHETATVNNYIRDSDSGDGSDSYGTETGDDDDDDDDEVQETTKKINKNSLRVKLREWDTKYKIPRAAGNALIQILKSEKDLNNLKGLPNDWRAIKTIPKKEIPFPLDVKQKCGGQYMYFGVSKSLQYFFRPNDEDDGTVHLVFNTDGVSLTESSSNGFWPLYGRAQPGRRFIIALFYGDSDPTDFNEFMYDFIEEAKVLLRCGVHIAKKHYKFRTSYFTGDTPAKAHVLNAKGPSGYSSCPRCKVKGARTYYKEKYSNIHFVNLHEAGRKAEDYLDPQNYGTGENYFHKGPTKVSEIIDPVQQCVVDSMHAAYGTVKKLVLAIITGYPSLPKKIKPVISKEKLKALSESLENLALNNFSPTEFARKPRSLKYLPKYKGTELRQFLLYTGVALLKGKIPEEHYYNFLLFSVAVRYLNMYDYYSQEMREIAETLFENFISTCITLYGEPFISHVVHILYHMPEDAFHWGKIDELSCFDFEDGNLSIVNAVKSGNKPLEQVVNWWNRKVYCEMLKNSINDDGDDDSKCVELTHRKTNGMYCGLRLKNLHFRTNREGDRFCCISTTKLIRLEAFHYNEDGVIEILGRLFRQVSPLFHEPCDSRDVGIYKCEQLSSSTVQFAPEEITGKLYPIPSSTSRKKYTLIKLLHL